MALICLAMETIRLTTNGVCVHTYMCLSPLKGATCILKNVAFCLSFAIRVNLLHPQPSSFLFGLFCGVCLP